MQTPLIQSLSFLIQVSFGLYFLMVLLRFLFQYFHISFANPISQLILKGTNPILIPMQRVIPRYKNIDLSIILLLIGIKALELSLLTLLSTASVPKPLGLIIWPLCSILAQSVNVFFFATLIISLLSWFMPMHHTPATSLLLQLTEPLMRPARRLLPATGGFDFSPVVVLIGLKLIDILLVNPLLNLGLLLSL